MNNLNRDLKNFIDFLVEQKINIILEKDETKNDSGNDTAPADSNDSIDAGGGLEDLASDLDNSSDDSEGFSKTDGEDVDGAPPGDEEDNSDELDSGSSFSGGGSSSGGGGFGSGGLSFDDETSDSDTSEENTDSEQEDMIQISDDPIEAIVDVAKELRTKTGDSQLILNSVKSIIQNKFFNFEEALPVIQLLWDTDDQILQQVATKLILFIKGR